jgi:hypothetical protein
VADQHGAGDAELVAERDDVARDILAPLRARGRIRAAVGALIQNDDPAARREEAGDRVPYLQRVCEPVQAHDRQRSLAPRGDP